MARIGKDVSGKFYFASGRCAVQRHVRGTWAHATWRTGRRLGLLQRSAMPNWRVRSPTQGLTGCILPPDRPFQLALLCSLCRSKSREAAGAPTSAGRLRE